MNSTAFQTIIQKRIDTFAYIRDINVRSGYYLKTAQVHAGTVNDARRAKELFVIGTSVGGIIESQYSQSSLLEYLRQINGLLAEYESIQPGKKIFSNLSISGIRRRPFEVDSASSLLTIHVPFDLDLRETLITLCDVMILLYSRILNLIPSATTNATYNELFVKMDTKVKKLLLDSAIRDLEKNARSHVRSELLSLQKAMDSM